jgi:hypothetical protein
MNRIFACLIAIVLALAGTVAAAQELSSDPINYELWDDLADLTETAVDQKVETTAGYESNSAPWAPPRKMGSRRMILPYAGPIWKNV